MKVKDPNRPRPWVIYKGGRTPHATRKGPGRVAPQIPWSPDPLASTTARAESFAPHAPDAPKRARRTMVASWGSAGGVVPFPVPKFNPRKVQP